jgi:hypothetical protein
MEKLHEKTDENSPSLEKVIEESMVKRVDEFLKTIRSQKKTLKKLYETGKTGTLLKERGTELSTFQRAVSRMRKGIGLFNDPILLTAILDDTGYPAHALFSDDNEPKINMNLIIGPGTTDSLENIIYRAVQEAQNPETRIAKIEKRLIAANEVYSNVNLFCHAKNFTLSLNNLFLKHSKIKPEIYKHREDKQLAQVDKLIKYIYKNMHNIQEKNNDFGKLLSLAYVLFEIIRICKAFIFYSEKKKRKTLPLKSNYEGFVFHSDYSKKNIENYIKEINNVF